MTKTIVIHVNSDLDPVTCPIGTDDEIEAARAALRLAGLVWENVVDGGKVTRARFYAEAADQEEADADDDRPCLCGSCNGSGEGMYDGSTCHTCGGSGEERDYEAERDREDERADYLRDQEKDDRSLPF
jgi:hypothetical protein